MHVGVHSGLLVQEESVLDLYEGLNEATVDGEGAHVGKISFRVVPGLPDGLDFADRGLVVVELGGLEEGTEPGLGDVLLARGGDGEQRRAACE